MSSSNIDSDVIKTFESVIKMSLISEAALQALNDPSLPHDIKVTVLKSTVFPSDAQIASAVGEASNKNSVVTSAPPGFRRLVESYLDQKLSELNPLNKILLSDVSADNIRPEVEKAQKKLLVNIEKLSTQYKNCRNVYICKYKNLSDAATSLNNNVSAASREALNLFKNVSSSIVRDAQDETLLAIETKLKQELRNLSQEESDLNRKLEPFKGREKNFLDLSRELDELNSEIATQEEIVKLAHQWNANELNESVMNLSLSDDSLSFA